MGILARSWNSNGTRPIPVHVAQFESQPVGQEENMSFITLHLQCGARLRPSGYTAYLPANWGTEEYMMQLSGIIIFK